MKTKRPSGLKVFVLGIEKGRFRISLKRKVNRSADLGAEGLSLLLQKVKFDPLAEDQHLVCSSSMDFPEEDGARKGFDAHDALREAVVLMFPEEKRAKIRAAMEKESRS